MQAFGGRFVHHASWFHVALGNIETALLKKRFKDVHRPVYVCGLARAGTTMVLELLSTHEDMTAHAYKDFPFLFTPYMWNRFLQKFQKTEQDAVERSHNDGLMVTADSPEAFEEMLWRHFFKRNEVLDAKSENEVFEVFYKAHIQKLLLAKGGERYLSKANYLLTRLGYVAKICPDAQFIIPVRDPVWHVASLMKQDALFIEMQQDSRFRSYLKHAGHFEFGLDKQFMDVGDDAALLDVQAAFAKGDEVRGWALYWDMVHSYLHTLLKETPSLTGRVKVVSYDALCEAPEKNARAVLDFCGLSESVAVMAKAQGIKAPSYYSVPFSEEEQESIRQVTQKGARLFECV
jgi:hypothetical protein